MALGFNKSALKNPKLWAVLLLTNIGILTTQGVILDGSTAAVAAGWVVTVLAALGFRGWTDPQLPAGE